MTVGKKTAGIAGLALACATCACGASGHGRTITSASAPATAPPKPFQAVAPPRSAGLAGNGRTSQAAQICRPFVEHADLQLHLGVAAIGPSIGPGLYPSLEGLSRRLEFLSGPAAARASLRRFAAQLDHAANTAESMGSESISSAAAFRRFQRTRATLATELRDANAMARALGLSACVIELQPHAPG